MTSKKTINRAKKRVEIASIKCANASNLCDDAELDRSMAHAACSNAYSEYRKAEDAFHKAYDAYDRAQLESIRADNRYNVASKSDGKSYREYSRAYDVYKKYVKK